jgi:hypothetical protein
MALEKYDFLVVLSGYDVVKIDREGKCVVQIVLRSIRRWTFQLIRQLEEYLELLQPQE